MSTNELFPPDAGQQLSPRLRWLRDNHIAVRSVDCGIGIMYVAEQGNEYNEPWTWANGATEDDAIAELAQKLGLRLWFEEAK